MRPKTVCEECARENRTWFMQFEANSRTLAMCSRYDILYEELVAAPFNLNEWFYKT